MPMAAVKAEDKAKTEAAYGVLKDLKKEGHDAFMEE